MTKKYSALRDHDRPSLERLLPLPFPISVFLETTNRCNYRCRYCPTSLPEFEETVGGLRCMNKAEFDKICGDLEAGGRLKVLRFYFMGEPLLNPQLAEMIGKAHRMHLAERIELTTNGVLLDEQRARSLIGSGLDYLRISISSVDFKRQREVTQTNVQVEHILENIMRFRHIRDEAGGSQPFLYVKMLDSLDAAENSKFLRMYHCIADEVVIEKPMNWDGFNDHDLLGAAYGKESNVATTEGYPYPKAVCPFPFYTLVISVNGDVTVCCADWNKATKVGNVFRRSLKEVWVGDELRSLRELHMRRQRSLNPSCRACTFLYTTPDNLDRMSYTLVRKILGERR